MDNPVELNETQLSNLELDQLSLLRGEFKLYINRKITSLRGELIEMFEDDFNKAISDMDTDFRKEVEDLNKKLDTKTDFLDIKKKLIDVDRHLFELNERISKLIKKNYDLKMLLKDFIIKEY